MSGGAMPKQEKVERVAELKARIEGSDALLLTEYRGLTVSEITELRRSLGEGGTRFQVIKNTLMRRAVSDAGVAEIETLIEGPSAVAFVEGDPVAAAKSVVDAAKKFPTLVLKGGYMDGKLLSADDAKALAALESREVMLSKIAGLVKSEMSKAAALFVGAQSKFVSLLEAYREKVPGDAAESTAAGDAAESTAADSVPESTEEAEEPQAGGAEDGGAGSASADSAAPEAETAAEGEASSEETPEAEAEADGESEASEEE
jgi:large subunit ribosomal protein L10